MQLPTLSGRLTLGAAYYVCWFVRPGNSRMRDPRFSNKASLNEH